MRVAILPRPGPRSHTTGRHWGAWLGEEEDHDQRCDGWHNLQTEWAANWNTEAKAKSKFAAKTDDGDLLVKCAMTHCPIALCT